MIDDKRDDEALPTDHQSRQTAAIVGPGSIGGTIAAWLAASDAISVTLCVRTPFDRLVVETPTTRLDVAPRQISRPDAAQPVDWVLIATKTYDVAGTAAWLAQLVGPETRVAVLQNGVEHVRRFADHVPSDRLLPVMVDIPAERDAPGRIRQRRRGTMEVPAGRAGHAFAALFERAEIDVSESSDFVTAIWQKLCVNSAGAVSVLSNEPGGVARREPAAAIMRALIRECIAVGRAEGAVLDNSLIEFGRPALSRCPGGSVNSMLADRRASRPMEWDARNGVVGRLGRAHGIATPVSDTVAGLLATIDESARSKR